MIPNDRLNQLIVKDSTDGRGFLESDTVFHKDNTVESLGLYLYDTLNQVYLASAKKHGYSLGDKIVRTVKFYDAYSVSNSDFPLLKVFRVSSSFSNRSLNNTNTINIHYSLVLPEQEKLQPLLHGISKAINNALLSPTCPLMIQRGLTFQYRTLMSELNQAVYSYLTTNITVVE